MDHVLLVRIRCLLVFRASALAGKEARYSSGESNVSISLRDMRADLVDMRTYGEFLDAVLPEYMPRREPQARVDDHKEIVRTPGLASFGVVAECNGEIVGIASSHNRGLAYLGGAIGVMVVVAPGHRRQGLGRRLLEEASRRAADAGFTYWMCSVSIDLPGAMEWALARDFTEIDRSYHLVFNLARWEETEARAILEAAKARRIRIASLEEMRREDADWARRLQELCLSFVDDLPAEFDTTTVFPRDLEEFTAFLEGESRLAFAGSFVAIVDGTWAATTWLSRAEEGADWCVHPMTGVHPDFRRRGLVKALKQAAFAWAHRSGIAVIHTAQQETNAPMLGLNRHLGFEVKSCDVYLRRDLVPSSPAPG